MNSLKKWIPALCACLTILLLISAGTAAAQGIKERMMERLPAVNALKEKGLVGEDNKGFLTPKGDLGGQAALVEEENNDRLTVYTAIAKQQNISPALVGQRRALQIAEIALPGTWVQDEKGGWSRK